jgi:ribosomal protein S18 acetylase RimI-like enzyme
VTRQVIRTARTTDVESIRLLMKSVPGFWDDTWRPDVLERALISADDLAIVSPSGDAIEGFICAHDLGFRAYVSELIVSPSAQGMGIGSELLSEVDRRLAARGCAVAIADVWRDAEGFYRAQGWSPPSVVLLRKHTT